MNDSKWILCKEKMPTITGEYLITIESPFSILDYIRLTHTAYWNGKYWECHDHADVFEVYADGGSDSDTDDKVVAWMELPKPYGEE